MRSMSVYKMGANAFRAASCPFVDRPLFLKNGDVPPLKPLTCRTTIHHLYSELSLPLARNGVAN